MPERKTTIPMVGKQVPVTDVPILKANEPASEYELEDGSVLRVRFTASSIMRVDDQYESNGDPIYLVRNGTAVTLLQTGESAKKK